MIGDVIEAAAQLAETAEPTVAEALDRYQRLPNPISWQGQVWISVAFMLDRHSKMAAALPGGH